MKQLQIATSGAYGFTSGTFFPVLLRARVDTFCDVRWRRGVCGALYAFVNSEHLQEKLQEVDIRHLYRRDLVPDPATCAIQEEGDKERRIPKRSRERLEQGFFERIGKPFVGTLSIRYVGFAEPLAELAAQTLLRVSLACWWRLRPEDEERCYLQLSGWYMQ